MSLWTPNIEKLLRRWKAQIGKLQSAHKKMASRFSRANMLCGAPAKMFNAIVIFGIFATFQNCDCKQKDALCTAEEWIRFSLGILGAISMVFDALYNFLDFGQRSTNHQEAAEEFESLYRAIDVILLTPVEARGDAIGVLQSIRSQFDENIKKAKSKLPKKYDISLDFTVVSPEDVPTAPSPSRVPNFNEDEEMLMKLADDSTPTPNSQSDGSGENEGSDEKECEVHMNDLEYNYSDEENPIPIEFDLDSIQPIRLSENLRIAQLCKQEKANLKFSRTQRTASFDPLTFELARFQRNFEQK